jgi:hypothetical protein
MAVLFLKEAKRGRNKINPVASRSRAVEIDGFRFASQAEGRRYLDLKEMSRRGEIEELRVHPRFDLEVAGELVAIYEADFSYRRDGQIVVEDVKGWQKGPAMRLFQLKARLLRALTGIAVMMVGPKGSTPVERHGHGR